MKKLLTCIVLLANFGLAQGFDTGVKDMNVSGSQSISGLTYQPNGMLTILDKGGTSVDGAYQLGMSDMTDNDGSVAISSYSLDGNSTGASKTYNDSGYVFLEVNYNGVSDIEANFTSVDAEGMTYNVTDGGTSHDMAYAIFGGGQTQVKVGHFVASGTTGNQAVTGVGFTPNVVIFMGYNESTAHIGGNNTDMRLNIGWMTDAGDQYAQGQNSKNSNLFAYGGQDAGACYITISTGINDRAVYSSMDADGFTINWTNAHGGVLQYMAIGGVEAYADTSMFRTGTGTFSETGAGFQPEFILGGWNRTSGTAGGSNLAQGLGFASGTGTADQHYMSTSRDHGSNPTETNQWSDDTYFLREVNYNEGNNIGYIDIDSFDADGVTFNQLDASNAYMFGYLLLRTIEAVPAWQINIGDSWKEVGGVWINIGDVWKEVPATQINIGDVWKDN